MIPEGVEYRLKKKDALLIEQLARETCIPTPQLGAAAVRYLLGSMQAWNRWDVVRGYHEESTWEGEAKNVRVDLSAAEIQVLEMLASVLEENRKSAGDWKQKRHQIRPLTIVGCAFREFHTYMKRRRPRKPIRGEEIFPKPNRSVAIPFAQTPRDIARLAKLIRSRDDTSWVTRKESTLYCATCGGTLELDESFDAPTKLIAEFGFRKIHEQSCRPADAPPSLKKARAR